MTNNLFYIYFLPYRPPLTEGEHHINISLIYMSDIHIIYTYIYISYKYKFKSHTALAFYKKEKGSSRRTKGAEHMWYSISQECWTTVRKGLKQEPLREMHDTKVMCLVYASKNINIVCWMLGFSLSIYWLNGGIESLMFSFQPEEFE